MKIKMISPWGMIAVMAKQNGYQSPSELILAMALAHIALSPDDVKRIRNAWRRN